MGGGAGSLGVPGEGSLGGVQGRFRGCLGGCSAVRASHLANKSENKTPGVFFQAAFDFDAPGPQNTTPKSKNIEKLNFKKVGFSLFFDF